MKVQTASVLAERDFTEDNQEFFAQLSGDFNPIHVDETAARRLIFGSRVVHGVHALLWVLDQLTQISPEGHQIAHLSVTFDEPIFLNQSITLRVSETGDHRVQLQAQVSGRTVITVEVAWGVGSKDLHVSSQVTTHPIEQPCRSWNENELEGVSGNLGLYLDRNSLNQQFPTLNTILDFSQIAILLATTRLVGMECPGLHSLYSELKISFPGKNRSKQVHKTTRTGALNYQVAKWNPRFRMVDINISSAQAQGVVSCFVRPSPVLQPHYQEIARRIRSGSFSGQTALIVGGSRGLGEVTAKLIAAGGGRALVTYKSGRDEALALVEEIRSGGGSGTALLLDVLNEDLVSDGDSREVLEANRPITHFYFFASPRILPNKKGFFDDKLFQHYRSFYVEGVERLLNQLARFAISNFTLFYPSTIYLEEPDPVFSEYIAAKKEGEEVCSKLQSRYSRVQMITKRLPRLHTDQTQGLFSSEVQDPVNVMLTALSK